MAMNQAMKSMGMALMYPPDVAGWESGQAWITSATMVERIAWGDRIFGQSKGGRNPIRYPAYELLSSNPTSEGIVDKLVSVFDAPIRQERRRILVEAANKALGTGLTRANANVVASKVSKLIFATPEFQFA
jgi:hypothetical protein